MYSYFEKHLLGGRTVSKATFVPAAEDDAVRLLQILPTRRCFEKYFPLWMRCAIRRNADGRRRTAHTTRTGSGAGRGAYRRALCKCLIRGGRLTTARSLRG